MPIELTAEQQSSLDKLVVPFHPDAISWRVTNKSRDGKRGCVIPYADQRAYTDRLNEIFSPAGWTRTYEVTAVTAITRAKKDKTIQTGKVIVTSVVTIHGLGSHCGSGEMWADDDNAMTRAEAQAFKRACSCFGLGRYFYDFPEIWVDLNEYGQPAKLPTLPEWALPPGVVPIDRGEQRSQPPAAAKTETGRQPSAGPQPVTGRLDAELTARIGSFRRELGDALFLEVFRMGGFASNVRELPSAEAQKWLLEQFSIIHRGIQRLRDLADQVPEHVFYSALDAHAVQSIDKIPSFETLKALVIDLQKAAQQAAA